MPGTTTPAEVAETFRLAGYTTSPTSFDVSALLRPTPPTTPMMAVAALIDTLGLPTMGGLDRFIASEIEAERVRCGYHEREVARSSGVRFSGMEPDAYRPRGFDAILEDAVAAKARRVAWEQTPEGRFHKAACLIATATGDERLLNCATRGVAHEIDRAQALLSGMSGPAADDARAAMADLSQSLKHAAE